MNLRRLLVACVLALASCDTDNEDECSSGDTQCSDSDTVERCEFNWFLLSWTWQAGEDCRSEGKTCDIVDGTATCVP